MQPLTATSIRHPLVWSSFAWLIPFAVAIHFDAVILAVLPVLIMLTSITCHITDNFIIDRTDELVAIIYIIVGPYLLFLAGWPVLELFFSALLTVFALSFFLYSHHALKMERINAYIHTHSW